ncbi:hypothetical protein M409DRAFT_21647 [Zasmidium cellare ATCC 36951]|uniref:FAD-binding domain-containing protein n=1 Tax=Zasmidium cellare ATCC 36951 TaxID=1080233 RepID=A0A6A6CQV3_ZASCE|nr:uncharacterized protein M409DRAFT_21647 [Zasmidium cellare ATCC 36951]KAF2168202.1 hypothetical protein M409DRAFT_21647 [Zasmidium cellare ATCC 36951]
MKILIIGAGLGGLCAAIAFAHSSSPSKKHQVLVFESRPTLSPTQGGINVRPAATRIMNTWNLQTSLRRIAEPTSSFINRNLYTGKVANRTILVDATREEDWGTTRDELVRVLLERARGAGVRVEFGVGVEDVWEDGERAFVKLGDGRVEEGDLVVAAGGIRSRVRGQILEDVVAGGRSVDPIVSDVTLYGVRVEDTDDVPSLLATDSEYVVTWIGRDAFCISRYNRTLRHARGLFGIRGQTDQKGLWDEQGDINFVRQAFSTACPDLRAMLEKATSCDRWRLAELPDLPRWTSRHGKIVLLGDSAHAMEPNAAHGFSSTVEDVGVLEYLVNRFEGQEAAANVPAITREWERIRKPRVERIKAWANENTAVFLGEPPKDRVLRESGEGRRISLKAVKPRMDGHFDSREFLKWTLDYDAVEEARKIVEGPSRANL